MPNVSTGLCCHLLVAKTPKFYHYIDFNDLRKLISEYGCTTTNIPLSNGIKIVSVLQRLHGKIGHTNSDVKSVIDRQTNRQKTQRFWPPRVKSKPYQIWHGDRRPRTRSCICITVPASTYSFAARERWKFEGNLLPRLKTPINSITPWANPSKF